jgi:hypothetical protein
MGFNHTVIVPRVPGVMGPTLSEEIMLFLGLNGNMIIRERSLSSILPSDSTMMSSIIIMQVLRTP